MRKAKTKNKPVKFQCKADKGSKISVAGSFNSWDAKIHKLKPNQTSGQHEIELELPPGTYEYKFIINDEWRIDPECKQWVCNEFGTMNSVIEVV